MDSQSYCKKVNNINQIENQWGHPNADELRVTPHGSPLRACHAALPLTVGPLLRRPPLTHRRWTWPPKPQTLTRSWGVVATANAVVPLSSRATTHTAPRICHRRRTSDSTIQTRTRTPVADQTTRKKENEKRLGPSRHRSRVKTRVTGRS
jgi:hypothetical protein